MRALWSGAISFGLVNIPVKLYSASKERALKFRMLTKDGLCPVSYKKVCRENNDKEVSQDEIVKGYEVEKGQYVILEPEDFKRASARKTEVIDIVSFTDEYKIDTKLFDKPYFIEPERKAAKAYVLLRDALKQSGKAAIGKFVMRDKEHICVVRPDANILILDQLRYADEIRDVDEIRVPEKATYSKKELDLAKALIENQTEDFKPQEYTDTYTEALMKVIKAKAKGQLKDVREPTAEYKATEVTDILEMLKKSLDEEKKHAHSR